MNVLSALNTFQKDQQAILDHANQSCALQATLETFSFDFYKDALSLSSVCYFENLMHNLLDEEKKEFQDIAFIDFWIAILNSFQRYNLRDSDAISEVIHHLLRINNDKIVNHSSTDLSKKIKDLDVGQYFHLTLSKESNLKQIVTYEKIDSLAYNIYVYQTEYGCSKNQGGLKGIAYEKAYPLSFYSKVPAFEIFGPDCSHEILSSLHIDLLIEAVNNYDEESFIYCFKSFSCYKEEPLCFKTFSISENSLTKKFQVFIYHLITLAFKDKSYEFYKALMGYSKVLSMTALFKSLEKLDKSIVCEKIQFLLKSTKIVSKSLIKQQDNPYFLNVFEMCVGTISELKNKLSQLLEDTPFKIAINLKTQPSNQEELSLQSVAKVEEFFKIQKDNTKDYDKCSSIKNFYLKDFAYYASDLNSLFLHIEDFEKHYPDMLIVFLSTLLKTISLFSIEVFWNQFDEKTLNQALIFFEKIAEKLATHVYKYDRQFSIEAQNCSICIFTNAYFVSCLLDKASILKNYFPEFLGFKNLIFQNEFSSQINASNWRLRKKLLKFIKIQSKDKKILFDFVDFEKNEKLFSEEIFKRYPSIEEKLSSLKDLLKQEDPEGYKGIGIEQLFWKELIENQYLIDESIKVYSSLAKTAMHSMMVCASKSRYQEGFENKVYIFKSFHFDLTYAKSCFSDACKSTKNVKAHKNWNHQIVSQNEIIDRYQDLIYKVDSWFILEEALTSHFLSAYQIIFSLSQNLYLLKSEKIRNILKTYLLKVFVDENNGQFLTLEKDIKKNPKSFEKLLANFFEKITVHINEDNEMLYLAVELYCLFCGFYKKLKKEFFPSYHQTLKSILKRKNTTSAIVSALKLLETDPRSSFDEYKQVAAIFVQMVHQKDIILTGSQQLWWSNLRFEMAQKYFSDSNNIVDVFYDYLDMSEDFGVWQPVEEEILKQSDFKRLFSSRIKEWKKIGPYNFSFYDSIYGLIRVEILKEDITIKKIERKSTYRYFNETQATDLIKIPFCLSIVCSFWIHEDKHIAKGYDLANPEKVFLKRDAKGKVFFKENKKFKYVELVESKVGSALNLYDSYNVYTKKIFQGIENTHIDEKFFPFLKVCFERQRSYFYQKNKNFEKLVCLSFKEGFYLPGIVKTAKSLDKKIIVAFIKHGTSKDSLLVHPIISSVDNLDVKTLEIKLNSSGFDPSNFLQKIFSAYLSLVGKDYFAAYRYLETVRYDEEISDDALCAINWLVDSYFETKDCSGRSTSIKLKAYAILISKIENKNLKVLRQQIPKTSIESLIISYLNHLSTVPLLLKIDANQIDLLIEKGMFLSKPVQYSEEEWKQFFNNFFSLKQEVTKFEIIPKERKSLIERWSLLNELPEDNFTVSDELVKSFIAVKPFSLIPGKKYPLKAFGFHYQTISQSRSLQEQWSLIYKIETTKIPPILKNALKAAFMKQTTSIKLPVIEGTENDSRLIVERWLSQFLVGTKELLKQVEKRDLNFIETKRCEPLKGLKPLLLLKHSFVTPFSLLESFKKQFVLKSPLKKKDDIPHSFKKDKEALINQEMTYYIEEWNKGKALLNERIDGYHPDKNYFICLEKNLYIYARDNKKELVKEKIVNLLNRRPLEKHHLLPYVLKELKEDISKQSFDTLLKNIFIKDSHQRLELLKKTNELLTLQDLKQIDCYLKYYLEASIVDKILSSAHQLVKKIVEQFDDLKPQEISDTYKKIKSHFSIYYAEKDLQELFFEYKAGFCLRKDQVLLLKKITETILKKNATNKMTSLVFQAFMSGGKTSVILARLSKILSDLNYLPFFVTHHSQYPFLKSLLKTKHYERHTQEFLELTFFDGNDKSSDDLKNTMDKLLEAKNKKRVVLVQTKELLGLRCELVSNVKKLIDSKNLDDNLFSRIRSIAKLFKFIQDNAIFLEDEIDLVSDVLEEYNLSTGEKVVVSNSTLKLIEQVYLILSTDLEIDSVLKIQDDDHTCSIQNLKEIVFPKLIEVLLKNYPPLNRLIPLNDQQQFSLFIKKFTLGDKFLEGVDLEFYQSLLKLKNKPHYEESLKCLSLLKGLFHFILPIVLTKKCRQNYGFHLNKLVPYLGVDSPNTTEFGNIYVMSCYYFQAAVKTPISLEMLESLKEKMQKASIQHAFECSVEDNQTDIALKFLELTSLRLHSKWSSKEINQSLKILNESITKKFLFYHEYAKGVLSYNKQVINAGPHALIGMSKATVGCAAILWNKEIYSSDLQDNIHFEKGGEGAVIVKLKKDIIDKKSHIYHVDQLTPQKFIDAYLKAGKECHLRAIIDVAGFLRKFKNEQVATSILEVAALQDEIAAVLYLQKSTKGDCFCLKLKDSDELIRLEAPTLSEIEKHVDINKVFVYFDELRSTGSDIVLKDDAHCLVTFDEMSTTMRSLSQGIMRARGFFDSQTVDIVCFKSVEFESYDIDEIYKKAIINQALVKQSFLLKSYFDEIKEKYRLAVFQKIIDSFSNDQFNAESLNLFHTYEWLFFKSVQEDPVNEFLQIFEEKQAFAVLKAYADDLKSRFLEPNTDFFLSNEIDALQGQVDKILTFAKNALTNVFCTSAKQQDFEMLVTQENETLAELNTETETQNQIKNHYIKPTSQLAKRVEWKVNSEKPTDFYDYQSPKILSINELLHAYDYEKDYSPIFSIDLRFSENFIKTYEDRFSLFHLSQKKIYYFLVVKSKNQLFSLFLDLLETSYWREELNQHPDLPCWLFNLDGFALNDDKIIPSDLLQFVKTTCFLGHFINGNLIYLMKDKTFLKKWLRGDHLDLKIQYLSLKTTSDPIQASIFSREDLFKETHYCKSSLIEDDIDAEYVGSVKIDQINTLPFHAARFMKSGQVPYLNKSGFFLYLPKKMFSFVTKQQIPLLPIHCYLYLSLKEQIKGVDKKNYKYLGKKALKHIKSKDLIFLSSMQVASLSQKKIRLYQEKMIEKLGVVNFVEKVSDSLIPYIVPEAVTYLKDKDLKKLTTRAQLNRVKVEKYPFLKASQFHLIPEEKWPHLQSQDFLKYSYEKTIDPNAKAFIQFIPKELVGILDERLAPFYNEEQVRNIKDKHLIKHLSVDQLCFLRVDQLVHLTDEQLKSLDSRHKILIELLDEPNVFKKLSTEAVRLLTVEQIYLIEDRETLLKLSYNRAINFSHFQIKLLDPSHSVDQEFIKRFNDDQISVLSDELKISFMPYLHKDVIKNFSQDLFINVKKIDINQIQYLSAKQLQKLLEGNSHRTKQIKLFLTAMKEEQWKGLSLKFIVHFFRDQPLNIVRLIPKKIIKKCPKELLYRFLNLNSKKAKIRDASRGIFSILFYPIILLMALFSKKSRLALYYPLFLFGRETYYRNFFLNKAIKR